MLDKIKTLKEILKPDAIKLDIPIEEYIKTYTEKERFEIFIKELCSKIKSNKYTVGEFVDVSYDNLYKYLNKEYCFILNKEAYLNILSCIEDIKTYHKKRTQSANGYWDENPNEFIKRIEKAIEASAKWREENPEEHKIIARMGYDAAKEKLHECQKKWREENPERFMEIQKMATDAFVNSEYFHSEEHFLSMSKGGVASSVVNLAKGNVGEDSTMSRYKIAKNRKKWALALMNIDKSEFSSKEAKQYVTTKQFHNILNRSNLIYDTGNRGGYHNQTRYYALNLDAINIALLVPDDFDCYKFKK